MATTKKHRKQWVITNEKNSRLLKYLTSFLEMELFQGLYLYYDEDLSISHMDWKKNSESFILGIMLGEPDSPNDFQVHVGRFVTITDGILSLDATGSLGVFYDTTNSEIIASSSPALISEIADRKSTGRNLQGAKLNWDILPFCRLDGIKKLMIGQDLDLIRQKTQLRVQKINGGFSTEKSIELLKNELLKTAGNLKSIDKEIFLAMTGGLDSRTIFSALVEAQVPFKAFTMVLDDVRSKIDAKIASNLCHYFNIDHLIVEKKSGFEKDVEVYNNHSGGVSGDRGSKYAAGGYYRNIPDNALVLHGGCFEIGQCYYKDDFNDVDTSNPESFLISFQANFGRLTITEQNALKEWYDFRNKNPVEGVSWSDLFYIDQRRAGWGAANRQEEDVFGFDWCIYINSWKFVNILLSQPFHNRIKSDLQLKVMSSFSKSYIDLECVNPSISNFSKIKNLIRSEEPLKNIFEIVKRKIKFI